MNEEYVKRLELENANLRELLQLALNDFEKIGADVECSIDTGCEDCPLHKSDLSDTCIWKHHEKANELIENVEHRNLFKACPFCGSFPDNYFRVRPGSCEVQVYVICRECGIEFTKSVMSGSPLYRLLEANDSICEKWDKRVEVIAKTQDGDDEQ